MKLGYADKKQGKPIEWYIVSLGVSMRLDRCTKPCVNIQFPASLGMVTMMLQIDGHILLGFLDARPFHPTFGIGDPMSVLLHNPQI